MEMIVVRCLLRPPPQPRRSPGNLVVEQARVGVSFGGSPD